MDKKIIFISKDSTLFTDLIPTVTNEGYHTDHFSYDELSTSDIQWEQYRVCVIEHGDALKTFAVCDNARLKNTTLKIIFITHNSPINVVEDRIIHAYPDNIISHVIPFIQTKIIATINKLFAEDIFGFSFYLTREHAIHTITVNDSKQKKNYIKRIIEYGMNNEIRSRILGTIVNVLDEMIMNAIYNAPTDESGNFIYANVDRREQVLLSEKQAATLSYVVNDYSIGLSMRDPFGSLKKDKVLYYLYKCKIKGRDQIDAHKSGAGLGIYKTFMNVNDFIINIHAGKSTEFIVFISTGENYMKSETQSFNIFIQE